jgi:hypothetical protein
VFARGSLVILEGAATDREDGPLSSDSRFRWSSDLEGELGLGRDLRLQDLRPGWHSITLRVTDSNGFSAQDSVSLLIGSRRWLPMLLAGG